MFQSRRVSGRVGVRWVPGGGAGWVSVAGSQKRHKETQILWQLPKQAIFLSMFSGKAGKHFLVNG